MKAIVIKEANRDRIEAALAEVQGKCKERTVSAEKILAAPAAIKATYGISMANMECCTFEIDMNAQHFPNAYRFKPMSTHLFLEVSKGNFKLTDIQRAECWRSSTIRANLTEQAKAALVEHFTRFDLRF